jgi:hypothetical protein
MTVRFCDYTGYLGYTAEAGYRGRMRIPVSKRARVLRFHISITQLRNDPKKKTNRHIYLVDVEPSLTSEG